nr:alcohol dehydrogenase catalytic domain-containing protein [Streptomyces sp. NEAU-383]
MAPGATATDACAELLAGTDEDEAVLTAGGRFVPRITERRPATHAVRPFALPVADDGPAWTAVAASEPAPGEVVIEVRAAALNYADIMVSRGLVPPMAETPEDGTPLLGLECAGVVTQVGADVTDRAVGDRVMVAQSGSLASHVHCPARLTIPVPEHMPFTEAATIPTVFATVHYGLDYLARLRHGETILVHGAAGGVGLAALRYAEHVGATVVATAGTPQNASCCASSATNTYWTREVSASPTRSSTSPRAAGWTSCSTRWRGRRWAAAWNCCGRTAGSWSSASATSSPTTRSPCGRSPVASPSSESTSTACSRATARWPGR